MLGTAAHTAPTSLSQAVCVGSGSGRPAASACCERLWNQPFRHSNLRQWAMLSE